MPHGGKRASTVGPAPLDLPVAGRDSPVALSAIPRDFHRQVRRLVRELFESTLGAPADDEVHRHAGLALLGHLGDLSDLGN